MLTYLRHDPVLGQRFIPDLKLRIPTEDGGYRIRTNEAGFRSDSEFRPEPGGKPRILLFGDSFTAGDGVSNGKRYSDLIERDLPVEVYNFGLPGTGTDQHYLAWRHCAAGIAHQAVVIAVLVENIRRITAAYRMWQDAEGNVLFRAKPYFELCDGELVRRNDPVPAELVSADQAGKDAAVDRGGRFPGLRKLIRTAGLQEAIQRLSRYQPTPDYDDPQSAGWQLMRAILTKWRREISVPVVLMPLPLYQHVEETADPSAYRARFRELARDEDFILHDPIDDLWSYPPEKRREFRFRRDVHLTPEGHAAIARSLEKTISKIIGT